jgi:hypothetical protein
MPAVSDTLSLGQLLQHSSTSQAACVALDVHELGMLLEGIDMSRVRISRRWKPATQSIVA